MGGGWEEAKLRLGEVDGQSAPWSLMFRDEVEVNILVRLKVSGRIGVRPSFLGWFMCVKVVSFAAKNTFGCR